MKKYLFIFTFLYIQCFSQEKIKLSHASQYDDFIELGLEMDKPTSKFDLIRLDTLTVTDNKMNVLKENKDDFLNYGYNNGRSKTVHYSIPEKKFKTLTIKGVMKYFTPSEEKGSYFNLGKLKNIKRNINLVDKAITDKNPDLYFSVIDSTAFNKVFPNFRYKSDNGKDYQNPDFKSYDIMYAYKDSNQQKLIYFINDSPLPGHNNLILSDKKTGIIYKLVKLKQNMSPSERDQINVEFMIENEKSVKKIPFELKDVTVVEK